MIVDSVWMALISLVFGYFFGFSAGASLAFEEKRYQGIAAIVAMGLFAIYAVWQFALFELPPVKAVGLAILLFSFAGGCYHSIAMSKSHLKQKDKNGKAIIVGITGTIASGKSLVGKLLKQEGVPVIDTDHVVHKLLKSDAAVQAKLRSRFGAGIFGSDGSVDRKKLGAIVFKNAEDRAALEAIVHPATIEACQTLIAALGQQKVVAVLVPLLFEAKLDSHYDTTWAVIAADSVVRERLKKRDGLSDEEVESRLKAQMPQAEKALLADSVIDNSGSAETTKAQVLHLLSKLRS